MDGSAELVQLAALLRLAAGTSRQIAVFRPSDAADIQLLAERVERVADELEAIAGRRPDLAVTSDRPN